MSTNQENAWNAFYKSNGRPWRGISNLEGIHFPEGSNILEVGCGNGKTAEALSNLHITVTGIDFSQSAIDVCIKRSIKNAYFIRANVLSLPFRDNYFDGATVFHVFEHLSYNELIIAAKEIVRVLKKSSHILVKVFSEGDMRSNQGVVIGKHTVIKGNGISYHYFSEDELCQIFSGCTCLSIVTTDEKTHFGRSRKKIYADFVVRV